MNALVNASVISHGKLFLEAETTYGSTLYEEAGARRLTSPKLGLTGVKSPHLRGIATLGAWQVGLKSDISAALPGRDRSIMW